MKYTLSLIALLVGVHTVSVAQKCLTSFKARQTMAQNPVAHLPAGWYIIHITGNDIAETRKVYITH